MSERPTVAEIYAAAERLKPFEAQEFVVLRDDWNELVRLFPGDRPGQASAAVGHEKYLGVQVVLFEDERELVAYAHMRQALDVLVIWLQRNGPYSLKAKPLPEASRG